MLYVVCCCGGLLTYAYNIYQAARNMMCYNIDYMITVRLYGSMLEVGGSYIGTLQYQEVVATHRRALSILKPTDDPADELKPLKD